MVELRLLGPAQVLASNGSSIDALTRQPKRVALLAYLAIATPRGLHRRDKLLGIFWPELDEAHARNALSQALHVLRGALGEGAIVTRGDDEVGIGRDTMVSDVAEFESALDASDPASALPLYRGELLDGFFISDVPEFERWLDHERSRLRQRAADGAWTLAQQRAAAADPIQAAHWARRATQMLPLDEAVARRLMRLLHDIGDDAAAMRCYDELCERMRTEYELEPSAETQNLVASIRAGNVLAKDAKETNDERRARTLDRSHHEDRLKWRSRWIIAAALTIAIAAVSLPAIARQRDAAPVETRFTLDFPAAQPITDVAGSSIVLSPDGSRLLFLGGDNRGRRLYLRPLNRLEATPIPYTDGALHPFFSPDGESIGFQVAGKLQTVDLRGGPVTTICSPGAMIQGVSWGPGNLIVYATPVALWRVQAGGGIPRAIVFADTAHGELFRWPEVLPTGDAVLFTTFRRSGARLAVAMLETGAVRDLGVDGTNPRFVAPDHLVFARLDGQLLTGQFDLVTRRMSSELDTISQTIVVGVAGAAKLGVSRSGQLAYMRQSDRSLALVDRAGKAELLGGPPIPSQRFSSPRIAPDGKRIAVQVDFAGQPLSNVWVLDLPRAVLGRITTDSGSFSAVWEPDSKRLIYATMRPGYPTGFSLRRSVATGADDADHGEEVLLPAHPGQFVDDVSPDGHTLIIERRVVTGFDLWLARRDGQQSVIPYVIAKGDQQAASVSPDGHWAAYVSNESGSYEVYVRAFPVPDAARMISVGGGTEPRWARDGRELFYRTGRGRLMSAPVVLSGGFKIGEHRQLFDDRAFVGSRTRAVYDVTPDGRRFVMVQRGTTGGEVIMHLNWFAARRSRF